LGETAELGRLAQSEPTPCGSDGLEGKAQRRSQQAGGQAAKAVGRSVGLTVSLTQSLSYFAHYGQRCVHADTCLNSAWSGSHGVDHGDGYNAIGC
jgi:hypothetical protein